MSARSGLKLLQKVAPALEADFDHLFEPAGGPLAAFGGAGGHRAADSGRAIGMIDGGVASHPSLAAIASSKTDSPARPSRPDTGPPSPRCCRQSGPLPRRCPRRALVCRRRLWRQPGGGLRDQHRPGARLAVSHHPQVINISLVGPSNRLVERAIESMQARGIRIVAAVGNDGPRRRHNIRLPIRASRRNRRRRRRPGASRSRASCAPRFRRPGADMAAAAPGQGYARVRGTSFAAPLAAARLMLAGSRRARRRGSTGRPGWGRHRLWFVPGRSELPSAPADPRRDEDRKPPSFSKQEPVEAPVEVKGE